jgi:hypothetical protein
MNNFRNNLSDIYGVRMDTMKYIESLVKDLLRYDRNKYSMARRAFVSSLRAYARHSEFKDIFRVKKLNLSHLSKSFGLKDVKSKNET